MLNGLKYKAFVCILFLFTEIALGVTKKKQSKEQRNVSKVRQIIRMSAYTDSKSNEA